MASRRLKSDRFIAKDFTADVYTSAGIAWVNDNSLVSMLLRHFPQAWSGAVRREQRLQALERRGIVSATCGSRAVRIYEAIVRGLESVGVDAAFGGAGENAAGMMIALKHSQKIRPVITRHEQGASFMACGYAMFTNKLGVCWATAGPGAFNLFSGLAVAMSDSYPLLAISGYASLEWTRQGRAQRDVGRQPDAGFAGDVHRDHQEELAADRCRRDDATSWRRRSTSPSRGGPARCTSTSPRTSPTTASR